MTDEMVSVLSYLSEASVTEGAGVGPLPSMTVHVAPQVTRSREAFITNLAGVRLPCRVNPLVVVQVAGRREPKHYHLVPLNLDSISLTLDNEIFFKKYDSFMIFTFYSTS